MTTLSRLTVKALLYVTRVCFTAVSFFIYVYLYLCLHACTSISGKGMLLATLFFFLEMKRL